MNGILLYCNINMFLYCMHLVVIVSEGFEAPFIGFIKTGECHILRMVEVMHTLSNGRRVIHSSSICFVTALNTGPDNQGK